MKNWTLFYLAFILYNSLSAQPLEASFNDECTNPAIFGGFGEFCALSFEATTIGATYNNETDLFSCDPTSIKSSVFFLFNPAVENVEFNLLEGSNINVTVLKYVENECNTESLELTENCFMNLNPNPGNPNINSNVLFTNITPMQQHILAIWTTENEETDFRFCLLRAPAFECGDNECYPLAENYTNCPQDCPCIVPIAGSINCE